MGDRPLLALTLAETGEALEALGYSAVHAAPIRRALLRGDDPAGTRASPRALSGLAERHPWTGSRDAEQHPAPDGSTKHLIGLADGEVIEAVRLPGSPKSKPSACLTTQVGCAMACRFCASGLDKVRRNLSVDELLEQLVHLRRAGPVERLVFMGAGEPTQNLAALARALEILRDEAGVGPKKTVVSTVGPAKAIDRLADLGLRFTLALSLHSATADVRAGLIPTQAGASPASLVEAADRFSERMRRPYQVEYVLLRGVNDSSADAAALARLLVGRWCHVSVIRWNPVEGMDFDPPSREAARAFVARLHSSDVSARLRTTVGGDTTAACGQLRAGRSSTITSSSRAPTR